MKAAFQVNDEIVTLNVSSTIKINCDIELQHIESDVYIKHNLNETIHRITISKSKLSKTIQDCILDNTSNNRFGLCVENPMVIYDIEEFAMTFALNYINLQTDVEIPAPEYPLKNLHLSYLLEEYELFKFMLDTGKTTREQYIYMSHYMKAALFFKLEQLHKKLCAITVYILKQKSNSELKTLYTL